MIDTNQNNVGTLSLHLLSINFDRLLADNLSSIEACLRQYTINNQDNDKLQDYSIGINKAGTVGIFSFYDDSFLGINSTIKIARGNLTIHEWAKKILTNYCTWLRKQYQMQSNMSAYEICNLLNHQTFINALFDINDYSNWIISQIDLLTAQEISFKFLPILDQQFVRKLIIRLAQIKSINTSVVSNLLQTIMTYYDTVQKDYHYTYIINFLINLLLQKGNTNIKLIIDQQINYNLIVTNLYHMQAANYQITKLKQINLPIEGIYHIDMTNILNYNTKYHVPHNMQSQLLHIKLTAKYANSIELLVDNLWHYLFYTDEKTVIDNVKAVIKYFNIAKIKLQNNIMIAIDNQFKRQHIKKKAQSAIYQIVNLLIAK